MSIITSTELAYRAAVNTHSGAWMVLIAPQDRVSLVVDELADALSEATETEILIINASTDLRIFVDDLLKGRDHVCVIQHTDEWLEEHWRHLDALRSRLEREGSTILVLSDNCAHRFQVNAPNFASWIGANVWTWAPAADTLSADQIETRLRTLRDWAGITDDQMISAVEKGELVLGPQHVEWLVLLGRGDLVS